MAVEKVGTGGSVICIATNVSLYKTRNQMPSINIKLTYTTSKWFLVLHQAL